MHRMVGLIVALQAGCIEAGVEYPGAPELALGFGRDDFSSVNDGDIIPITTGPQGGILIYGAVRGRYLDPHDVELVFSIASTQGAPSLRRVLADFAGSDDGLTMGTSLGHHVFLFDEDRFAGLPCVWRVEATDREGRTAVDEKIVVPMRLE